MLNFYPGAMDNFGTEYVGLRSGVDKIADRRAIEESSESHRLRRYLRFGDGLGDDFGCNWRTG